MSAWIAVSERMPDADMVVMIALANSSEPVWIGVYEDGGRWRDDQGMPVDVTHWMALPEPPK